MTFLKEISFSVFTILVLPMLISCVSTSKKVNKNQGPQAKVLENYVSKESRFVILKAGSNRPDALCRDFRLTSSEAREFFLEAKEVETVEEGTDGEGLFACYVKGILKIDKQRLPWIIRYDGTGTLELSKKTSILLECLACASRYSGHED